MPLDARKLGWPFGIINRMCFAYLFVNQAGTLLVCNRDDVSVQRNGAGDYTVTHPEMVNFGAAPLAMVQGPQAKFANSYSSSTTTVEVNIYTAAGAPSDDYFYLWLFIQPVAWNQV